MGCIVVRDKRILVTGYNGAPAGCKSCIEKNECYRNVEKIPSGEQPQKCYATHAEQNAIAQAAYMGTSLKDATLYVTHSPCSMCARIIINSGIKHVKYLIHYADKFAEQLYKEAGVKITKIDVTPDLLEKIQKLS